MMDIDDDGCDCFELGFILMLVTSAMAMKELLLCR